MALGFDDSFKELEEFVMDYMQRIYSGKVIDHFLAPRNLGQIQTPAEFGRVTGYC